MALLAYTCTGDVKIKPVDDLGGGAAATGTGTGAGADAGTAAAAAVVARGGGGGGKTDAVVSSSSDQLSSESPAPNDMLKGGDERQGRLF
jgi:hypothetical protein